MNQRIINIAAYTIAVFVFFYLFLPEIVKLFEKPSGLPIVWKETVGVIDPNVYKSGKIMYYVGSNMYV